MMFLRIKKSCVATGVDIGSSVVTMVTVRRGRRLCVLECEQLPREQFVRQASSLLKRRQVTIGLPTGLVFRKIFPFSTALEGGAIISLVRDDAKQYLPHPASDMYFDVRRCQDGEEDVLLIAANNEDVDRRVNLIEETGAVVSQVDVEGYALQALLPYLDDVEGTVAILMTRAGQLSLNIFQRRRLIYTREQSDCHDRVTAVSQALQLFYSSCDQERLDRLYVVGNEADACFINEMNSHFDFPSSLADPFVSVGLGPKIDREVLQQQAPALAMALSLSLRG